MYSSKRIDDLANWFFTVLCNKYGYDNIDATNVFPSFNKFSYVDIFNKIESYKSIKHQGKCGPIEDSLQKSLNFKLALLELKNATWHDKQKLIKEVIAHNDKICDTKLRYKVENEFIINLLSEYDISKAGFLMFLKDFDLLFTQKKYELFLAVKEPESYNDHLHTMEDIFLKYLNKAIQLSQEQ